MQRRRCWRRAAAAAAATPGEWTLPWVPPWAGDPSRVPPLPPPPSHQALLTILVELSSLAVPSSLALQSGRVDFGRGCSRPRGRCALQQ